MRPGIRRRLFLLMLSGSALGILFLGLPMLHGVYELRNIINEKEANISRAVFFYTTEFAKEQGQEQIESEAEIRAGIMGYEAGIVQADVQYLGDELNDILRSPEQYPPLTVPNAREEDVPLGRVYVHYSPQLVQEGVSPALEQEIKAVSNLAGSMSSLGKYYKCIFVGSKHGYILRYDGEKESGGLSRLSMEPWRHIYDARERLWYSSGLKQQSPTYTEVYMGTDGELSISCVMPYYDADGIAGVVGVDCTASTFLPGGMEKGIEFFVLGSHGRVLLGHLPEKYAAEFPLGEDLRKSPVTSISFAARRMLQGSIGYRKLNLQGEEYYLCYAPVPKLSWSVGTLMDKARVANAAKSAQGRMMGKMDELKDSLQRMLAISLGLVIITVLLAVVLVSYGSAWASEYFCRPLRKLMEAAKEIAKGNFSYKLKVIPAGDEINHLAACFNGMTDELERYEQEIARTSRETSRIEAELLAAAHIQTSLLPAPLPARDDFQLAAVMFPAKEVGGDFYDFFYVDEDHLAVVIADVSDKGVSAALFMAAAKTVLKNSILSSSEGSTLAEAVAMANDQLAAENEEGLFVTVFAGILQLTTGEFTYVNGGHNPPLWQGETLAYLPLTKKSPLLGIMGGLAFEEKRIMLEPGNRLFLYTDGVTEAMDEKGQMFTKERLEKKLSLLSSRATPGEIIEDVLQEVHRHAGKAEQSDDITMLALKYAGQAAAMTAIKELAVPAEAEELVRVNDFVREMVTGIEVSDRCLEQLLLVVEEIFVNIADYAYDEGGQVVIKGRVYAQPSAIEISFSDTGHPYNPLTKSAPDFTTPLQQRQEGGLGIFLIQKYVEDISYKWQDGRNILTIYKKMT